jgi:hypothetical protein
MSGIDRSLWDGVNYVVAADQHVFGNIGVVTVVEGQQNTIHCFVYDRSKRPENTNCRPWCESGRTWSRKDLYYWLEESVRAIYYRSLYDTRWTLLEQGRKKLEKYNRDRDNGKSAKESYQQMWLAQGGNDD